MRQMSGKKRVVMTGISSLLVAGLVVGNIEYATHTYRYDSKVQAMAANNKVVEQTASFASSKKKSTVSKEETVYATLDANGGVTDVIVSDWLKNSGQVDSVKDSSTLKDITNTKGNEKFTQSGDSLTWDTSKSDIYYQGTAEKSELPVGMQITYKLDGEEVSPKDIVGKSGKLEMTIKYSNTSKKQVTVAGEKKDIYTPFLMATGMILPVDKFDNIDIDNGKVLSEGENNIVIAYGMPGLSESLDLKNVDLGDDVDVDTDELNDKITDSVKITADVKDFSMSQTYTVATADLFKDIDIDRVDDLDKLDDKIDDMKDAGEQLVDGTKSLKDGLNTLNKNFATYAKGIKSANKGAKALNKGAKSLKKGTNAYTKGTDQLLKGVNSYVKGAKSLGQGVNSYADGAKQIADGLNTLDKSTKTFPKQYKTFGDGVQTFVGAVSKLMTEENMKQLTDGTAALKAGVKSVDDGVGQLQAGMKQVNGLVENALQQQNELKALLANDSLTAEQKAAVKEALTALSSVDIVTNGKADGEYDKDGKADLAAGLASIKAATDTKSKEQNLYNGAAALDTIAQTMSGYAAQLRGSATQLLDGEKTVRDAITQISTNITKLSKGGKTLTANNKKLKSGAAAIVKNSSTITTNSKKLTKNSSVLRKGVKQLAAGTKSLFAGTKQLDKATGTVSSGISKLYKGSDKLNDGMNTFKKDAIDKLATTITDVTDGLDGTIDRIKGIQKASEDYQSFSGIDNDMNGSVKFVLSTQEVKKDE